MLVHSDAELYALLTVGVLRPSFRPSRTANSTHTDTITKPFKVCPNLPLFSRVPPLFLPCGERCTPTVFIVLSVRATLPYIQFYGLLWIVTLSVLVCTPNRPYTAFQRDTTVCRLSFPFGSVPIHHRPGLLNPRHSESRHAPTSRLLKAHSGHSLNCNPIFLASCSAPF